jgi:hypothetical protein
LVVDRLLLSGVGGTVVLVIGSDGLVVVDALTKKKK